MPARFPVPIKEDVRDLLVDLLGRGASVDKLKGSPLLDPALIAEFVTDESELGALCAVDAEFALRCGAALAMVPSTVVDEAIRKGELPPELVENVQEVANILAQLLDGPPHAPPAAEGAAPTPRGGARHGHGPAGVAGWRPLSSPGLITTTTCRPGTRCLP